MTCSNSRNSSLRVILLLFALSWLTASVCSRGLQRHHHHHHHHNYLRKQAQQVSTNVKLDLSHPNHVTLENGLASVVLSRPEGHITEVWYNGVQTLERRDPERHRGYWDIVWYEPGQPGNIDSMPGTEFKIIHQDNDLVEVSFSRRWDSSHRGTIAPLNVEKRFIMRRGSPGFYTYIVVERLKGWPDTFMDQLRLVFKLDGERFHYMAISEERQRMMPTQEDRKRGIRLAYQEAVLLKNTSNRAFDGEVDDKYQYSLEHQDNKVNGWVSPKDGIGFWLIFPSHEFRTGGPIKQELTSHVGPTLLGMFGSTHYAGLNMDTRYNSTYTWKMVYGPVFIYLNSASPNIPPRNLFQDAKTRMEQEEKSWPYDFVHSVDFPTRQQRGTVSGRFLVDDRFLSRNTSNNIMEARWAYLGLAMAGEAGSWQRDAKHYQFWTRSDNTGKFTIQNVRPGTYSLYGWVPGVLGDYKFQRAIVVNPGSHTELGSITFNPPRSGPTLWEIGVPDRSAAEFFVPKPESIYVNKLYNDYGLWKRYSELYPTEDITFTIGVSDHTKDWYFAHVTSRETKDGYRATNRMINFEMQEVLAGRNYTFRMVLAAAFDSKIEVTFNYPKVRYPVYTTERVGTDNAIARHGNHGLQWIYSINVPWNVLFKGTNTLVLRQTHGMGPFNGVMYDYLRFEGPSPN
ncbi:Rhamnogalacturonate lyase [Linum perenne]